MKNSNKPPHLQTQTQNDKEKYEKWRELIEVLNLTKIEFKQDKGLEELIELVVYCNDSVFFKPLKPIYLEHLKKYVTGVTTLATAKRNILTQMRIEVNRIDFSLVKNTLKNAH